MTSTATVFGCSNFSTGRNLNVNSVTRFCALSSNHLPTPFTTEANAQVIGRTAGDFSRIGIRVSANDGATNTLKFRIDTGGGGASGNNSATITPSTTGWFEDATPHTDTVAAGDKFCMAIVAGTSHVTGVTFHAMLVKFLAASGAATYYGAMAPDTITTFTIISSTVAIRNYALHLSGRSGGLEGAGTEAANERQRLRTGGVLSHAQTRFNTNAITVNVTFMVRINGSDGTNAALVTASTTGTFEDTTHSDSVSAGDVVCFNWRIPIEGTGHSSGMFGGYVMFVPSTSGFDILVANEINANLSGSTTVDNYYCVIGTSSRYITTEANAQIKMPFAVTLGNLRCYVQTSQASPLTLDLHVNASAVNETKTLTASTTGIFEDAVNHDSVVDGSALTYKHGPMVSTAGFNIAWFGITGDPGSGITPGNGSEVHHYNSVILG